MIVNIYLTLDFPKQNSIFANSYIKVTGGCLGGLNPVQISIQALAIIATPLILVVTVFTVTQRYIISLSVMIIKGIIKNWTSMGIIYTFPVLYL